jgi:Aminoglycoside-2''-adenylyltransferase
VPGRPLGGHCQTKSLIATIRRPALIENVDRGPVASGDVPAQKRRVRLVRTPEEQAEEDEFLAVYGRWKPLSPAQVVDELAGFARPWWVVGGWAIEAATGYQREHDDTDISILSTDVPAFVDHLRGRWHVWNNVGGVLHPLGDRWTTVDEPRSQLWLRANASAPWVLDVPLTPAANGGRWTNKHLDGHVATVEEVTWVAEDGIRYLLPEIVLVFKARLRRPKDEPDFEATLPILTAERREWMRNAVTRVAPDHPWLERF